MEAKFHAMPARIVQVKPTGQWTAKRTARRFSLVMLAPRFLRGRYGDEARHAPVAADFTTRLAPERPFCCGIPMRGVRKTSSTISRLAEILPSPSSPILDPRIAYRRPHISPSCDGDQPHAFARMQLPGLIDSNQGDGAGQDCGRAWATIRSPKGCPTLLVRTQLLPAGG